MSTVAISIYLWAVLCSHDSKFRNNTRKDAMYTTVHTLDGTRRKSPVPLSLSLTHTHKHTHSRELPLSPLAIKVSANYALVRIGVDHGLIPFAVNDPGREDEVRVPHICAYAGAHKRPGVAPTLEGCAHLDAEFFRKHLSRHIVGEQRRVFSLLLARPVQLHDRHLKNVSELEHAPQNMNQHIETDAGIMMRSNHSAWTVRKRRPNCGYLVARVRDTISEWGNVVRTEEE